MAKTIKKKQQEPELQKKAKHEQKMLKLGKNEKSLQKKNQSKTYMKQYRVRETPKHPKNV